MLKSVKDITKMSMNNCCYDQQNNKNKKKSITSVQRLDPGINKYTDGPFTWTESPEICNIKSVVHILQYCAIHIFNRKLPYFGSDMAYKF